MFWQEKIDLLKKRFGPEVFRDPFRRGIQIREKIFGKFFKTNLLVNIETRELKDAVRVLHARPADFWNQVWLALPGHTLYWLMVEKPPGGDAFQVYEGTREPLEAVIRSGKEGDRYFLVEKKYRWLVLLEKGDEDISLWKSGNETTPFG